MNSKLILAAVAIPLIAVAVAIALFTPPLLPGSHDVLSAAQQIHIPGAVGPESLVFDPTGRGPYTGVADGRVLKYTAGDWLEFALTSSSR